ncbi:MAG: NlpC/P60 family protein [Clostridia bacterium]|nr:NlpC/P60 family protein [Clostridia bacterium]
MLSPVKSIKSKIKGKLIMVGLGIIALLILLVVIIAAIGAVIEEISDAFFGWLRDNEKEYSNEVVALKDWSESTEFKQYYKDIMTKDKFEKYLDYEMRSWAEKIKFTIPVTTIDATEENTLEYKSSSEDYYFDLYSATKDYGTPWQLFAGIDIYKNLSHTDDDKVINFLDNKLRTKYYGLYGEEDTEVKLNEIKENMDFNYYKKVTKIKTVTVKKDDGEETTTYKKIRAYPLPYFYRIETFTHTITNHYEYETEVISNTVDKDKDEDKTVVTKIKEIVEEPVLKERRVSTNMSLFANTLVTLNIFRNNIKDLEFFISKLPYGDSVVGIIDSVYQYMSENTEFDDNKYPDIGGNINYDFVYPVLKSKENKYYRDDIAKMAKSVLGLDYFWGGKYFSRGFNKQWGKIKYEKTYGRYQRYGLDCSGFLDWVYINVTGRSVGKGGGTYSQWKHTRLISESELKVGDLGFYNWGGGKHVGIFIGRDNKGIPMFIHAGGSTWADSKHPRGQVIISKLNKSYKGYPPVKFRYFRRVKIDFVGDYE